LYGIGKLIVKKYRLLYNLKHILHILCIILQRKNNTIYKQHNDKYLLISKDSRSLATTSA
jgi:hypothetical protein